MNIESMGKFLVSFILLFTFSLLFSFSSFAETRDPESGGQTNTAIVNLYPNPPLNNKELRVNITGVGFMNILVEITAEGKSLSRNSFAVSANKIEEVSKSKLFPKVTTSPPPHGTSSWVINMLTLPEATSFVSQKKHTVTVYNESDLSKALTTISFTIPKGSGATSEAKSICTLENGVCKSVNTDLGEINPDPLQVVSTVLRYLIGISGGLFLLVFIRAGYRMVSSQGNPEAIKEARESITSAIVGFLFLLFSFVILEVIGVDLFQLPGFNS